MHFASNIFIVGSLLSSAILAFPQAAPADSAPTFASISLSEEPGSACAGATVTIDGPRTTADILFPHLAPSAPGFCRVCAVKVSVTQLPLVHFISFNMTGATTLPGPDSKSMVMLESIESRAAKRFAGPFDWEKGFSVVKKTQPSVLPNGSGEFRVWTCLLEDGGISVSRLQLTLARKVVPLTLSRLAAQAERLAELFRSRGLTQKD